MKDLLDGDARIIWLGDSWSMIHNTQRLPYGSLLTWPIDNLGAIGGGFRESGPVSGRDFSAGDGALVPVNQSNDWTAEYNGLSPAYFAVPINDMTKVLGLDGLRLDSSWIHGDRVQDIGVSNARIRLGDLPGFSDGEDLVRVRPLYYCPREPGDLVERIRFLDQDGEVRAHPFLRTESRGLWHLGDNPDAGDSRPATPSQVNALPADLPLVPDLGDGPKIIVSEDPDSPLVGSDDYWFLAGAVFFKVDRFGQRIPGLYHSGLATVSWRFRDYARNAESRGTKRFSDRQITHWLDVTTLDRTQPLIFALHMDTEEISGAELRTHTLAIMDRLTTACQNIGIDPPRFLLIGSYMHRIGPTADPEDRDRVVALNQTYLDIARTDDRAAFVSLYALTDGTFFVRDVYGGAGAQQAARDWLDDNGWSTIEYGGNSFNLSSDESGGADGNLLNDALHIGSTPAAAFFARLISDAITAAPCPGDMNGDDEIDSRDVILFLDAWTSGDEAADFNRDGEIDIRDFVAFLEAWNEPC